MSDGAEALAAEVAGLRAENERLRAWQASHVCVAAAPACTCSCTTATAGTLPWRPCPAHGVTLTCYQNTAGPYWGNATVAAAGCAGGITTFTVDTGNSPVYLGQAALTTGCATPPPVLTFTVPPTTTTPV